MGARPMINETDWRQSSTAQDRASDPSLDFTVTNTWLDLLGGRSPRVSLSLRKSMRRRSGVKYHAGHPEVVKARQLRRLGMAEAEIARELQVALEKVQRWGRLGFLNGDATSPGRAAPPAANTGARP